MKRILVIGSGGSGKSTFSRELSEKLGIAVVHLDRLFWLSGWTRRPTEEWLELLNSELEKDRWIMDGNFGATREKRMQRADTVIFLDLPRYICMYRVLKRTLLSRKGRRPDMADGCHERFDPEFVSWVWNYRDVSRPRILEELRNVAATKEIIVLEDRTAVTNFLNEVNGN